MFLPYGNVFAVIFTHIDADFWFSVSSGTKNQLILGVKKDDCEDYELVLRYV